MSERAIDKHRKPPFNFKCKYGMNDIYLWHVLMSCTNPFWPRKKQTEKFVILSINHPVWLNEIAATDRNEEEKLKTLKTRLN